MRRGRAVPVTAEVTVKGQFLRENRRNLEGEGGVGKILSPQRVASVSNLCNDLLNKKLRLRILKKLRTASLNSEFTGSYKKVYIIHL